MQWVETPKNQQLIKMNDLLICCIMIPLGSENCVLPILQKVLIQPQCSIFFCLLSNNLSVDKREYGHERMERSLDILGLLWNQTTLSRCHFVGFSQDTITFPHQTMMFFHIIVP
jgi:hypothetical protein